MTSTPGGAGCGPPPAPSRRRPDASRSPDPAGRHAVCRLDGEGRGHSGPIGRGAGPRPRGGDALMVEQPLVRTMPWSRTPTSGPEPLLSREWLVTNGLGGYASGTVSGVCTRRYHGLLIA